MSYISQLERELLRAAATRRRRPGRLPELGFGGAVYAVAGVAAVAFAVLALALLHHAPAAAPGAPDAVADDARPLVAQLAVLRRRQSDADRAINHTIKAGALERGLSRLAISAGAIKVWIVVLRSGSLGARALWPASMGALAQLVAQVGGRTYRSEPVPEWALHDPSTTIHAGEWLVELVPDGVARVRWSLPITTGTRTVSVGVTDNVAVAALGTTRAPMAQLARWLDSSGHAAATTPDRVLRRVVVRRAQRRAQLRGAATRVHFAVPASLTNAFTTLRTGPVSLPALTVTRPGPGHLPDAVLNMALGTSTRIDPGSILQVSTRDGLRVWIEPGAGGLCLAAPSGANGFASSCAPDLASGLRAGVWSVFARVGGTPELVGVVPGAHRRVALDLSGGGHRTVAVVDGLVITPDAGVSAWHLR